MENLRHRLGNMIDSTMGKLDTSWVGVTERDTRGNRSDVSKEMAKNYPELIKYMRHNIIKSNPEETDP